MRTSSSNLIDGQPFDRALRSNGHEGRRLHNAVRQMQSPASSLRLGVSV
jgi:hypothetical protein